MRESRAGDSLTLGLSETAGRHAIFSQLVDWSTFTSSQTGEGLHRARKSYFRVPPSRQKKYLPALEPLQCDFCDREPLTDEEGNWKATWKREFKLPWREAGPLNHQDDKIPKHTRGSFTVRKSRAGESFYLRVYGKLNHNMRCTLRGYTLHTRNPRGVGAFF